MKQIRICLLSIAYTHSDEASNHCSPLTPSHNFDSCGSCLIACACQNARTLSAPLTFHLYRHRMLCIKCATNNCVMAPSICCCCAMFEFVGCFDYGLLDLVILDTGKLGLGICAGDSYIGTRIFSPVFPFFSSPKDCHPDTDHNFCISATVNPKACPHQMVDHIVSYSNVIVVLVISYMLSRLGGLPAWPDESPTKGDVALHNFCA